MAIPNLNFTFPENGLGNVEPSPDATFAVFGSSSTGDLETPISIAGSPQNVVDQFGHGKGPDLAAALIQSGATVIFTRCDSTPQAAGAVTQTGTGTSVLTITGTANDRYDILVTVVQSGTIGDTPAGKFTLSVDGGLTVSGPISLPVAGIYAIENTGLTLNFAAGTVVLDDIYEASAEAPTVAASDVADAVDALKATNFTPSIAVIGEEFDQADTTTILNRFALFEADRRFLRVVCSAVDADPGDNAATWRSAILADWDGFESVLAGVCASFRAQSSVVTATRPWRPISWALACRLAEVQTSRDAGAVADGALPPYRGAVGLNDDVPDTDRFVWDEALTPGLDAENFITLRSFPGLNGVYVTNPHLSSSGTSDYRYIQHGRVMDKAAFLTNQYFTQQLSGDILVNPSTGKILEKEAKLLEAGNDSALSPLSDLQDVSAFATTVSREDDILNTETLTVTVSVVPKGYLKSIDITMAFTKSLS